MKRLLFLLAAALLPGVLLTSVLPASARAATSKTAVVAGKSAVSPDKAIVVAPFLTETTLQPSDVSKDVSITLTNNTTSDQSFVISALDFGSLGDTGGLVFAGNNADTLIHKYGLANWLQLPVGHLSLTAGQTTKLQATILNEASLGPGGHYAAIIMTVDNPPGSPGTTVNVQQKISALVFATKVGGEDYDMRLSTIKTLDGSWQDLPSLVSLTFKNTGNVHVVPRGTVKLIAPSGHVVSHGVINEASAYVLPETSRQIIVQTESVSNHGWEPGSYRLQVDYRYDGHDQFATKTIMLHYYNIRGIAVVILVLVIMGVVTYKLRWRRSKTLVV